MATPKATSAPASKRTKTTTGTKPANPRKQAAFDDEGLPLSSRFDLNTFVCANLENVALAMASHQDDDTGLMDHFSALTHSPMYHLLLNDYKAGVKKPGRLGTDWYLTLLCARMLLAGICYAKLQTEGGAK